MACLLCEQYVKAGLTNETLQEVWLKENDIGMQLLTKEKKDDQNKHYRK